MKSRIKALGVKKISKTKPWAMAIRVDKVLYMA